MTKKLVIGANGQIGTDLVEGLIKKYGAESVIASDISASKLPPSVPFILMDVLNKQMLIETIKKHEIKEIYLLAALLSATAEKKPLFAWELNINGLLNVLELAREGLIDKLFWPSSIAVFGTTTPQNNTPQTTIMEPSTVYGISKLAGERWCEYYHAKYGVDVRSIRYPGLISYKAQPGGGTTDYAVDIFHQAIAQGKYECYLAENTYLPMMYMTDAIRATLDLMNAPTEKIKIRSSYNINGLSFSPKEITNEIQKHIPHFTTTYNPDFRQEIANSWPKSIDDTKANEDWGWKSEVDLATLVNFMLKGIN